MRFIGLILLSFMLTGCFGPGIVEVDHLDPGTVEAAPPWVARTGGCGFCSGNDAPWASTFVLNHDGQALWFSFRPKTGESGDTLQNETGVVLAEEAEPFRDRIEYAVSMMVAGDTFHARDGTILVYDIRAFSVPSGDWEQMEDRLKDWTIDLTDAPPMESYGCEDCSGVYVQVITNAGVASGNILERDLRGPGTGNVAEGSDWWSIEAQLTHLTRLAEAQPS